MHPVPNLSFIDFTSQWRGERSGGVGNRGSVGVG